MILRVTDIPSYELHLLPITDLRQQIAQDRRARADEQRELDAQHRFLAARGEDKVESNSPVFG